MVFTILEPPGGDGTSNPRPQVAIGVDPNAPGLVRPGPGFYLGPEDLEYGFGDLEDLDGLEGLQALSAGKDMGGISGISASGLHLPLIPQVEGPLVVNTSPGVALAAGAGAVGAGTPFELNLKEPVSVVTMLEEGNPFEFNLDNLDLGSLMSQIQIPKFEIQMPKFDFGF